MPDLVINSLKGGMNDQDMPNGLDQDECALARNVERFYSRIGERRLGCQVFDITGSGLTTEARIVKLTERFPQNNIFLPEYWAISTTEGSATKVARYTAGMWTPVVPNDPILPLNPQIYRIQDTDLDGKKFWAYQSDVDRLHVWDGTQWRATGLVEPDPPTVADEGSGTYVGTRYFRVRYIVKDGDIIRLRSEPSESVQFVPSGTGAGALITRPALINEGETHWELEASVDNANFWRIQTIAVATTSTTDETDLSQGSYSEQGPVSEDIGDYLLQQSAKYVITDGDRIILGGHWTNLNLQSRVSWSPVRNDPGVGNDERQPLATGGDDYQDLDNFSGGGLTGLGSIANGTWYAFKWSRIYKAVRTGELTHAYQIVPIADTKGAIPNTIVSGLDEFGRACLYFLDPSVGPCSISASGLREHSGLRNTWKRVNRENAAVGSMGVYYPDKKQVHWWVPIDGGDGPGLKIILHVEEIQQGSAGTARGGWVIADGLIATCSAVGIWHEEVSDTSGVAPVSKLTARPFIGLDGRLGVHGGLITIQRTDVGDDDDGENYQAEIITQPYYVAGILNNWGAMAVSVLASSLTDAEVEVSCIRDFGREQNDVVVSLTPAADEGEFIIRKIDNLRISESTAIQLRFADPD